MTTVGSLSLILGLVCFVLLVVYIRYKKLQSQYEKIQSQYSSDQIGTIVVDNSDENTNLFLEIEHSDISKWENGKHYYVRVEVRDYVTQD